jgi:hypothetical protein
MKKDVSKQEPVPEYVESETTFAFIAVVFVTVIAVIVVLAGLAFWGCSVMGIK